MADLVKKVILDVELNTSSLINEQVKLRQSIEGVKSELDKLKEQRQIMSDWKQSTEDVDKDIIKLEGTLRNLNTQQKNLQKQVDISTKANQAQAGSYEQLLRQWELAAIKLKTLEGTLKQNEDGTFALTEEYRQQSKAVGDAKEALDTFNLTISDGRTNVGQYGKALEPIKAELKELNQTQQALNKTMLGLNALQSASSTILGENSVANNTLKSAISALVVVQNVGNIRQGVTASLMLATQVQSKALTAATVVQTTATGTLAGIQSFLQVQLGLSATAARVASIAFVGLATAGIGLVVIGMGVLISKLIDYINTSEDATAATIEETRALKVKADSLAFVSSITDKINESQKQLLQTQLEIAKKDGSSLSDQYKLRQQIFELDRKQFEQSIANAKQESEALLKKNKALTDDENKRLDELQVTLAAENTLRASFSEQQKAINLDYANDVAAKRQEDEEKYGEHLSKEFEAFKENQKLIEEALAAVDPATELERIVDAALEEAEINANIQADITADQKKESDERKKIAKEESDFKTALLNAEADLAQTRAQFVQSGAAQLRVFVRENSEAYKALFLTEQAAAIGQIIIRLNAEIASIAAANAILGPAGIPLTVAQSTAAKIRAGIGIATIAGQTFKEFIPKAEKGAMFTIGGKPHTQGGTKFYGDDGSRFEAEKDEVLAIVNKRSAGMLGSLSMINQMGGGIDFFKHGGLHYLADGGFAARAVSDPVISSFNSDQLVNAIREMQIFVNVNDINSLNNKKATVIERSTV